MALIVARWMLALAGTYLAAGILFAAAFLTVGIARIDPAGRTAPWGFRILVAPGVVALWPLLARRWASGRAHPPDPEDAHRRAARGGRS